MMPKFAIGCVCIILSLLSGCAAFQAKPLSPDDTATSFESRNLESARLKGFLQDCLGHEITPWPAASWNFTMLTVAACYFHPDIDVARAEFETAKAALITAGERPNPSIGITPEFVSNAAAGIAPWVFGLFPDIPIETAGKRTYRLAHAAHLSDAARLNIATAERKVRSRLRTALLNLYVAKRRERISNELLQLQADYVKLLTQRLDYGYISLPDLALARISLDQTRLSLKEVQAQIAENRVKLAEALGLPVSVLEGIEISFGFLETFPACPPSKEARRQALLYRPDILSALSEYEASQSALQLEIARQYPDIHLGPGYEYDQGENKWRLGFSVTLPIFNRNQGPIAEAKARRKEMAVRFAALQANVIGEIDLALVGYSKAFETLGAAEALLAAQERRERSVQARFEAGEDDRLALLAAKLQVYADIFSRLNALYHAQQALGLLEDALWRPLVPDGSFHPD